jgi:hypothetical protein
LRKPLLITLAFLAGLVLPDGAGADQWTVDRVSAGPSGGNGGQQAGLVDVTRDGSRILFKTTERLTPDDSDAAECEQPRR